MNLTHMNSISQTTHRKEFPFRGEMCFNFSFEKEKALVILDSFNKKYYNDLEILL